MRDLIESFCDEYGYEFRSDYSGRFMYGKTCVGFVCDSVQLGLEELEQYLTYNEATDFASNLYNIYSSDNMGLSMIVYFPEIE